MGLDSVELLISFEDKFGVSIPDAEAENIATLQQMADSIFEKVKLRPNDKCLSQIVFYNYEIAEITCPTKYFEEASSINLKSSVIYGLGVVKTSCMFFLAKRMKMNFTIFQKPLDQN